MTTADIARGKVFDFAPLEILAAVAVIGIFATVTIPTYQDYGRQGARAAVRAYLTDMARKQQQYYADHRAYAANTDALGYGAVPADVAANYTVTILVDGGPPAGFTLRAAPIGDQAIDRCATLVLTSTGARISSSGSNCW